MISVDAGMMQKEHCQTVSKQYSKLFAIY